MLRPVKTRSSRNAFTRRCRAMGSASNQYINNVRDIGFGKKFNGREFYGGGADD